MLQDLRHGVRMLARQPGVAALAVLLLAVGIGANAAIFSAANELFLRSAPAVAELHRLVALGRMSAEGYQGFSHLTFLHYRQQAESFTGLTASRTARLLWREGGETAVLEGRLVTADYFSVLGVPISPGRAFLPDEDRTQGTYPVAIISRELWKQRLGPDPAVIGRTLRLNDTDFTIIGVAAPGFRGLEVGEVVQVWLPLMMEGVTRQLFPALNSDLFSVLRVVGGLRPGVSRGQAEAELTVLASRIERPHEQPTRIVLTPHVRLPDPQWRASAASDLALLFTVSLLLLLLVCANLAGLLLARAAARRHELAVRLTLGASRSRITRQLLTESVVLALPAALAGLLVSSWVTALIRAHIGAEWDFRIDATVLLFTGLLAVLTALALGLAPALHATRSPLAPQLRERPAAGRPRAWGRKLLVAGQVAVSLVLLAGAGLFARTLQQASAIDPGFDTERLLLVTPDLELAGYTGKRAAEFYERLTERVAALPGVRAVSRANALPRHGNWFWDARELVVERGEAGTGSETFQVEYNEVAPRYFETLGMELLRGRDFTARDDAGAPLVAIVNETLARQLWPAGDPLGRQFRLVRFLGLSDAIQVVGVVRDSRTFVRDERIRPEVVVPLAQGPRAAVPRPGWNPTVVIRTADRPTAVAATLRRELNALDPALPPARVETLAERLAQAFSEQRMFAQVIGLFAALGLLLAAVGLYGTLAFRVSRRTHDLGVHMALGARHGQVAWLVMREGLTVAAAGAASGLLAALALTRALASRLYGVAPTDPLTFAAAVAVLMAATLLACWLPARRATRIEPAAALRAE